jgi:hypothetical protein
MTEASMMQQQVRIGFKLAALAATPRGSAAATDGVALFAAAPAAANPASRLAVGDFCTVTNSATDGTTMKFTRKGIYAFNVVVPLTAAETTAVMIAGSLDCAATFFDATNVTPANALVSAEDYDTGTGVAALQMTLKLSFKANITNTLRGSGTNANLTPNGTVRIHIADGAGATVTTASVIVAQGFLSCNQLAEIFG